MRIGIGAILGTVGGPATYARELIRALARIDPSNEYVVITDVPNPIDIPAANVRFVTVPLRSPFLQPAWDHVAVPYWVSRCRLDLYHGTKGILPLWSACGEVLTVHDLAVYHQPETFAWLQRLQQYTHTPWAVRRARRVIADSEHARQDLIDRFGLPSTQVVAVPLAAGAQFSAESRPEDAIIATTLGLPQRFVLYAGTIQPRKNVDLLVRAFAAVSKPADVELVIAGRVRPGYQPWFLRRPPERVRYLGPVSNETLAVLYRRAMALCSPSSYEGFGLSLLEAMASGCLVVAGRNSAVPELVDDGGVLLEELTVPALKAVLERVLGNDGSLEALRTAGRQRAAQYSWESTARKTLAVYREAIDDFRAAA